MIGYVFHPRIEIPRGYNVARYIEPLSEIAPPFLPQHCRTDDQKAPCRLPGLNLFPDVHGFDCLAEPDLICDQHAADRRLDKTHDWLELVGIKVRVAGLHRVEDVGELALNLLEGQDTPQIAGAAEHAVRKQIEYFLLLADGLQQVVPLELLLVRGEVYFHHEEASGPLYAPGGGALPPGIVAQADICPSDFGIPAGIPRFSDDFSHSLPKPQVVQ